MIVASLDISSWVGTSIGATHTYGKIKYRDAENKRVDVEVTKPMTARDAKAFNREMQSEGYSSARYKKAGDDSYQFANRDDVIKHGKKLAGKLFKGRDFILLLGDGCCLSAQSVLLYPPRFETQAQRMTELAEEWERIDGYEGNETRATEIDDEWLKLLREIDPKA